MIHRAALLSNLQKLLKRLEADLLERSQSTEIPGVGAQLRQEYEEATEANRTAQTFEEWRSDAITQTAAAWVLSCVFVRFLEDNTLIDPPRIAGPGERLQRSRDEHELYFRSHPTLNDRDYLIAVFDQLEEFPATRDVFGEHNPIRNIPNWLSGDAAGELLRFFQRIEPNTGALPTTSPTRPGIPASWATCIRTSPRRRGSGTRSSRRRSSSRSSFSIGRSTLQSRSSASPSRETRRGWNTRDGSIPTTVSG